MAVDPAAPRVIRSAKRRRGVEERGAERWLIAGQAD
jgi:hypothetical protein